MTWLRAISRQSKLGFKIEAAAPNFALDWCVRSISRVESRELDLGGWIKFTTTGERVRAETWRAFNDTFRECGFEPEEFIAAHPIHDGRAAGVAHAFGARN